MCERVLMVLASREASETFIAREIDALQKRGFPLFVASLDQLPQTQCKMQNAKCAIIWKRIMRELFAFAPRNALRIWRHRKKIQALVEMARELHATRLHAQFAWVAADVTGITAEILGIPWSCGVHAWDVFTRPGAELRRRLRSAECVIACNQRARDIVARAVTCHVHLIRHGIKLDTGKNACATLTGRNACPTILAIGRLVPKKGFDTLLVAMSRTCHKDAQCVFIGDGPERGKLERLATKLNLAARVKFLGALSHDDAMRELTAATLLALPSRKTRDGDSDGFANVLAEAMQHGTPIVTTIAAGAGELLAHNESALLVPPDDPAQLAVAIDSLIAQPVVRQRLADNARRVLETRLNEDVEIAKTARVLFTTP